RSSGTPLRGRKPKCEPFSSPSISCTTVANDSTSGDWDAASMYLRRTASQSLLPSRSSYQLSRMVRQHRSKAAAYFFGRSTSCTTLKRYEVSDEAPSSEAGAVNRLRGEDRRPPGPLAAAVEPGEAVEGRIVADRLAGTPST